LRTTFDGAMLRDANLMQASLRKTAFSNTDLRNANLAGSHIHNTFFDNGTKVAGLILWRAEICSFHVNWIDIAEEGDPQRLDGEEAEQWIRARATIAPQRRL
jgi:uncharacterized protein YjbI with pentapeptide repeats